MAERICRAHRRVLVERLDGRLFCDHGKAGHVVTTWDVLDHKGRTYGTAAEDVGKRNTGIDVVPAKETKLGAMCQTAEAAEKALAEQCRIAQERGWREMAAGGNRSLVLREIPWAGPEETVRAAQAPAPASVGRKTRARADA